VGASEKLKQFYRDGRGLNICKRQFFSPGRRRQKGESGECVIRKRGNQCRGPKTGTGATITKKTHMTGWIQHACSMKNQRKGKQERGDHENGLAAQREFKKVNLRDEILDEGSVPENRGTSGSWP